MLLPAAVAKYGTPAFVCRRRSSHRALHHGFERLSLSMLAEQCPGQAHSYTRIHGVSMNRPRPSRPRPAAPGVISRFSHEKKNNLYEHSSIRRNTFIHGREADVPPTTETKTHHPRHAQRAHSVPPLAHPSYPVNCLAPPTSVIRLSHTPQNYRSSHPSFHPLSVR